MENVVLKLFSLQVQSRNFVDKGILKVTIWKIVSVGYVCLSKVDSCYDG
jgi:hypothetical protein